MTPDPIDTKTLGGLTYNTNQVKSAKKLRNGTYEIIFNSGERLNYPEQRPFQVSERTGEQATATTGENISSFDADAYDWHNQNVFPRNATITQTVDENLIYDDTYFDITNVMGARFTSHGDTVSHVKLHNSSNTTIDLSANNSFLYGDNAEIEGGAYNKVVLDKRDSAEINGKTVEGEGTAAQKDY